MTEKLREELLREYYYAADMIDKYDDRVLRIKTWGVTLSIAMIGYAFSQNISLLLLMGAASSLIFWFMEARWKYYQYVWIKMQSELEAALQAQEFVYSGPGINSRFQKMLNKDRHRKGKGWRILLFTTVMVPHIFVVFGGICLFFLEAFKMIKI